MAEAQSAGNSENNDDTAAGASHDANLEESSTRESSIHEASAGETDAQSVVSPETRPTVVVTGASTGIGYAAAKELSEHGYRVVGTVRKDEDADRLRKELGRNVQPLLLDIAEDEQIADAAQAIEAWVGTAGLVGLVNNAGIAIAGPLMHVDLDDLRYQFDVNVVGTVAVTQALYPLLARKQAETGRPGRIINISSVSGHTTYPFLAPYAASKHALESISDGMRRELMLYGIDVIVMVLGAVKTPIWEKTENQDMERYQATDYAASLAQMYKSVVESGKTGMPVDKASRAIRQVLETQKPRARYVLANNRLMGWLLPRWMPDRLLDWALSKQLGLHPEP